MNQFIVRYYDEDELILDLVVESWQEYVYTLKNSDEVKISNRRYEIGNVCMTHDNSGKGGMVIYVDVDVKRTGKKQENTVRNAKNYYSR